MIRFYNEQIQIDNFYLKWNFIAIYEMYGFIFKLFLLYMDIETNIDKTNQHCFDGVKSLLKTFPRIFFLIHAPRSLFSEISYDDFIAFVLL